MNKIHLTILGLKNFETNDLEILKKELDDIHLQINYRSVLYEPLKDLNRKINTILRKRETSKQVWVRFSCSWSGYNNSSAPRRTLGAEYRKLNRDVAEKLPKYFCHRFDDSSTNDWNISIVNVKGKEKSSAYSHQVDEFLERFTAKK